MAEATGLRNNALPYPVYGAPWGFTFALLDADGDPVSGAASLDSEISKNGDTFADCTNEATEIATSSGSYYLLLTGTELTTDVATVQVKATGVKTAVVTLFPRKLVTIRSGTANDDGTGTSSIVLDSNASAVDDYYNGMLCVAVLDSVTEARIITDYNGSTKAATVTPDWNTAPDNTDTFTIYLPEGAWHPSVYAEKIYSDTTIITSDLAEVDTSDIRSALTALTTSGGLLSDMASKVTRIHSDTISLASDLAEGDFSDILSRLTVANSQLLVVKSDTSDIKSHLVVIQSETTAIQSDTTTLASDLAEGDFSDILSRLTLVHSETTSVQSRLILVHSETTDIQSETEVIQSLAVAIEAFVSDAYSDTTAIHTLATKIDSDQASQFVIIEENTSDTESMLLLIRSDTTAIEGTVGGGEGDISDVLSRLTVTNSQLLIVKSDTSDIRSNLAVLVGAGGVISDIASGVDAIQAAGAALTSDQDSKLTAVATTVLTGGTLFEMVSDVYSDTTAIESAGGGLTVAQASKLTQIQSDVISQFVVIEQNTSDTESMLALIRSDTTHIESDAVAIEAIVSDIQSDTNKLVSDATEVDTSDLMSRLTLVHSETTAVQSRLILVHSETTDIQSETEVIQSDTAAIEAAGGGLTVAQASKLTQIQSDAIVIGSQVLVVKSDTSDLKSHLTVVNSETTAIQSKTNNLTFTVAGQVDANIEYVNGTEVGGTGALGDEWGPA